MNFFKKKITRKEIYAPGVELNFDCSEVLYSKKSPYNTVEIVRSPYFGKVLLNDGVIMICEKDEFVYHEMISHVPLFVHPQPRNILVIGGGDGGTAREVVKHPLVESCKVVEIDALVVEACKKHIPQTASVYSHPKVKIRIEDGIKYVLNTKEKYDLVIVDSSDPIGPAIPLFEENFYKGVYNILNDDGIMVSQAESPFYLPESQKKLYSISCSVFPIVHLYHYSNCSYPGGLWSFLFSSKKYHPVLDLNTKRVQEFPLDFQYYNVGIHRGAFASPSFVKKALSRSK